MSDDAPLIKLFLQHQSDFMAYLMAITRDFTAAEEIFQNAAVVVIERSATREEVRDFRAWAKEVIRRQALLYLRQQSQRARRVRPLEPALLDQIGRAFVEDDTSESVLRREIAALQDCIREVPETGRKMLSLRYEQRASFRQIAAIVKRTEAAVQRALSRLRKSLHDCVRSKVSLSEGGTI
jgi:RNA polymerase sigma-70 factor (ECF subfamily)